MKLAALLVFTLLTAASVRAQPATQPAEEKPESLAEIKAKELAQAVKEVAVLPVIEAKCIDEVFQITLKEKDLHIVPKISATETTSLVRVPTMPGISTIEFSGEPALGNPPPLERFTFTNRDFTVPDAVAAFTTVSFAAGVTQVVQEWETADEQLYSVQLLQDTRPKEEPEPRVTLYVQVTYEQPPIDLRYTAASIVELRRAQPAEVAKYVDPIFRTLRQEGLIAKVDSKLAWQVFAAAYSPPPELMSQVQALVTRLNSDNFQEREAASKDLEKLGQPAALALGRIDRSGLSEEQRTRLDTFITKFRTVSEADAQRYRKDPDFLLDCLYSDEQPIRAQALAELEKLSGKMIDFDLAADEEHRGVAIGKLRQTIGAPTTRRFKAAVE